ncbi:MAG TPA: FGGY-family carbohydrate kinase, partial [Coleofasciculaceae cyanobacterium]
PNARGVFFGVALHHQQAHFTRAVLEGILYSVYSITVILQALSANPVTIRASGGFARSRPWRQMMADVLGCEVLVPEVYEGSSFGAAVLGMYAIGAIGNLSEVQSLVQIRDRYLPNLQRTQTYHQLFEIYQRIYSSLVEEFSLIADYQRRSL